jgi:hypothetical protein
MYKDHALFYFYRPQKIAQTKQYKKKKGKIDSDMKKYKQ